MFDDPMAAFADDTPDPLLGLTCDVPFVWKSVTDGRCPVCGSRLDRSREAVRSLSLPCSPRAAASFCGQRGRLTTKAH